MAELPYVPLKYTGQNKRTPTSVNHVSASNILESLQAICSGESMVNESVTTRMLSAELLQLITYGLQNIVDDYDDLPTPSTEGSIYLVRNSIEGYSKGFYKGNADDGYDFMSTWVSEAKDLSDMPQTKAGHGGEYLAVNADETAYELKTRYDRFSIKPVLAVGSAQCRFIADRAGELSDVIFRVDTAAVGADVKFKITKNGTNIFTGTGIVTYTAGNTAVASFSADLVADNTVAIGDVFIFEVTQVGSTTPGGAWAYLGVKY
jgi:hypothetical protein